jgi:hypothetical protein
MSLVGQYSPSLFQEVFAQLHEVVDGYVIEDWGAVAVRAAAPPPPGRARPSDRLRFCLERVPRWGRACALLASRRGRLPKRPAVCRSWRAVSASWPAFFGLVLRRGPTCGARRR